ncbi:MAG: endopeptidase La [Lachnospiraceae bacterium]|nr:endopeptidase La [Lachnospiraceae bacterium]
MNEEYPVITTRGLTILPGMLVHFDVSRPRTVAAGTAAMEGGSLLVCVAQKDAGETDPDVNDLYSTGCLTTVKQIIKLPGGAARFLVRGMERVRIREYLGTDPYLTAEIRTFTPLEVRGDLSEESETAMLRTLRQVFESYSEAFPKVGQSLETKVSENDDLGSLIDEIAANIPVSFENKQRVLDAVELGDRFDVITGILANETDVAKIRNSLSDGIRSRIDKNQRDYILREQLGYIRHELGDDEQSDSEHYRSELEKLDAPQEVKDAIEKQISRFERLGYSYSQEAQVERGYIETLLEMPWNRVSEDNSDIKNAEKILNEDHYGLEKVKERIIGFLAVRALKARENAGREDDPEGRERERVQSPVICLVGPPGTGKTSIGRSIARALGKKYARISLGGVRDEAEIRGHRRTYVGAMPGRIVQAIKNAGTSNPLIVLDEVDKTGKDYRGDVSAALLEVLDADQNTRFADHYIEIPIDLSGVLFIATANSMADIPGPLLDRMEVIEVTSYTENEKYHIACEHLIPKQLEKNGLTGRLKFTDGAVKKIISSYTKEAGVRRLERTIGEACRSVAKEILENGDEGQTVTVRSPDLKKYLGKVRYIPEKAENKDEAGVVTGLAWTSVGGSILKTEVVLMPGKGELMLTGQMGDVMKESARTALSFVRSVASDYDVQPSAFKKNDIHLHIPEGAVPKDGPSAGITMACALMSVFSDRPVRSDTAMTGEITLRGKVLPIGGLKEKLLAANKAGIRRVLIPEENKKDIEEISPEILGDMDLIFVSDMKEVLKECLR